MITQRLLARLYLLFSCALLSWSVGGWAEEAPFELVDRSIIVEQDRPLVCFAFSQPLNREAVGQLPTFVEVEPPVEGLPIGRDNSLCIAGLSHGQRYTITLKAGLPALSGMVLRFPIRQTLDIPDREPMIGFRSLRMILPWIGPDGLWMRAINVGQARLSVLRADDPALWERIYAAQSAADALVSGDELGRMTTMVWQSDLSVDAPRNTATSVSFPIDAVLASLAPGVYVATATLATGDGARGKPAIQWFIVPDLVLTGVSGEDGLTVFAHAMGSGRPVGGAELRVLGHSGRELARMVTGAADGVARISRNILSQGDDPPKAVIVRRSEGTAGPFAWLDLASPAIDLIAAVDAAAPRGMIAFLRTDRSVYRPGETIKILSVLRDGSGRAAERPLVLKLLRPDGFELRRVDVPPGNEGGYVGSITLSTAAVPGRWTITAEIPDDGVVGQALIQVDDQPPTALLSVRIDPFHLRPEPGEQVSLSVKATWPFGQVGGGLPGEAALLIRAAGDPFSDWSGYAFALEGEEAAVARRIALPAFTTDPAGCAVLSFSLPELPQIFRPMEAVLQAAVLDTGGHPVTASATLPIVTSPFYLGVRSQLQADTLPERDLARFDVIAVAADGSRVAAPAVRFEIFEETYDFSWFEASGRWDYRRTVKDRRVSAGEIAVSAVQPALVEQALPVGRYRIELFDPQGRVTTGVRFAVGTAVATPLTGAAIPDRVDVLPLKQSYRPGEVAAVYVRPPYASEVTVMLADREVRRFFTRAVGPEGAIIEIPVEDDWGTGTNIVALAFASGEERLRQVPRRMIGSGWIGIDPTIRSLGVKIGTSGSVSPGDRVDIPISINGLRHGEIAHVALFAVDRMADNRAPDIVRHVLGRRQLGIEIRDIFGRLLAPAINPVPPATGWVPAAGTDNFRAGDHLVFSSQVLTTGADGTVVVPVSLPPINQRIGMVAVAWTLDRIGQAEAEITATFPVELRALLPPRLASGDRTAARVELSTRAVGGRTVSVDIATEGALGLTAPSAGPSVLTVSPGVPRILSVGLEALPEGEDGHLIITIIDEDGRKLRRVFSLPVHDQRPVTVFRRRYRLYPEEKVTPVPLPGVMASFLPGTVTMSASLSPGPLFDAPTLLAGLRNGLPPLGIERAASLTLARIAGAEVVMALDPASLGAFQAAADRDLDKILALQRPDGTFLSWPGGSPVAPWFNAFVIDVLARARDAGMEVPEASWHLGLDLLNRTADNSWIAAGELPARAYGLFVLARAKRVDPSVVRVFADSFGAQLGTDLARAHLAVALHLTGDLRRAQAIAEQIGVARRAPDLDQTVDRGTALRDLAASCAVLAETGSAFSEWLSRLAEQLASLTAQNDRFTASETAWLLRVRQVMDERGRELRLLQSGVPVISDRPLYARIKPPDIPEWQNTGTVPINLSLTVSGVAASKLVPQGAGPTVSLLRRHIFDINGQPVDLAAVKPNTRLVIVLEGMAGADAADGLVLIDPLSAAITVDATRIAQAGLLASLGWLPDLSEILAYEGYQEGLALSVNTHGQDRRFRVAYMAHTLPPPGNYALAPARIELPGRQPVVSDDGSLRMVITD